MSCIIEGYNYDIFISYRQKDNQPTPGYGWQSKGDRWVSEFVEALKTELESTFKEGISVYFDINPHDGLLETHDVGESLKEKLKCLVFIPIISRTYCDPKSFAWEHECIAFVEQASKDKFGLKIKLPGGNVANRVLPVQIHDLDMADIKESESILGGFLRGIEFIYKEPGVNRPLTKKDNEEKNLNHTSYRNQINKVALAVKKIVSGLKGEPMDDSGEPKEFVSTIGLPPVQEKSIIVLPFENISSDNGMHQFWKSLILFYNNRADDAYDFICKFVEEPGNDTWTRLAIFLKYTIKRDKDKLILLLTSDFITSIRIDLQNSYHIATFYSYLGEIEMSLEFLENAINHGLINYPLISEIDPLLENIRGEERFKKLMERVKYEWENFEG